MQTIRVCEIKYNINYVQTVYIYSTEERLENQLNNDIVHTYHISLIKRK